MSEGRLKIGITCYPSVGGSGVLACALGEELIRRGHEVHFIGYERPFRLTEAAEFHRVTINQYELFKYPDYTLPLSVKMAEVSQAAGLDILHVHYAVPHATAAILARDMLPGNARPRIVTTLHGTDTMLLGRDPGYGPAIRHALEESDAVTAVSGFLEKETRELLGVKKKIDVIHNFFTPRQPRRTRAEVRAELGVGEKTLIFHSSNLRPVKRIDLLLESAARIRPLESFKLLILAGGDFTAYEEQVRGLGLEGRIVVRENVSEIEDYVQAADLGMFTSDIESFCLSILEGMCFGCPSVARRVGGIPEVVEDGVSGVLVASEDPGELAREAEGLIRDRDRRRRMGEAARRRAGERFSAEAVVGKYEKLYRRFGV